jgi:hypothetical protein
MTFSSEFMTGYYKEASALISQLFKQLMQTLQKRNDLAEYSAASGTSVTSSSNAPPPPPPHPAPTDVAASGLSVPVGHGGGTSSTAQVADRMRAISQFMKASRSAKHLFAQASKLFVVKPEKGLRYLQECGALPTPLTPKSVAAFLRLAPDLPKETTGCFLGELGHDSPSYEGNGKDFHTAVLLRYVESFEFRDQSVLDCMRIFLSAFRLPGEAQQIDRVLVAFSEHCFSQSLEGRTGVIENAEIAYVLTFSIIMLNTDRHNPNIKAEKRMTKEQFLRNNRNYGKDVKQTKPLSDEYLASIFTSIDSFPIRTEGKELAGAVTSEVWKDLQMQARADNRKAVLVTTSHDLEFVRALSCSSCSPPSAAAAAAAAVGSSLDGFLKESARVVESSADGEHGECGKSTRETEFIVYKLLTSKEGSATTSSVVDPLELSVEISGMHGIFDTDLLECVWQDIVRVCLSVPVQNLLVMRHNMAQELDQMNDQYAVEVTKDRRPIVLKQGQLRKLLAATSEYLTDFLRITNNHGLDFVLEGAFLLLTLCSGLMKVILFQSLFSRLKYHIWCF